MVVALAAVTIPAAAAVQPQVSVSANITDRQLRPGQNHTLGTFTVHARNASANVSDIITNKLPFTHWYTDTRFSVSASCTQSGNTTQCPYTNRTVNLTGYVSEDFSPGTYNAESIFVFDQRSNEKETYDVAVAEVVNWTVGNVTTQANISVDQRGRFGTVTVENHGNTDVSLTAEVTGPISQFVSTNPSIDVFLDNAELTLEYDVARDARFGRYTGNLVLTRGVNGSNDTVRRVNLSTTVLDDIYPEMGEVQVDDLMATRSTTFTVEATDNLGIANVTANVTRVATVRRNNKTVVVNRTVVAAEFSYDSDANLWEYTFDRSRNDGVYYADIVVRDAAGNTVRTVERFQVSRLNVTHVTDPRFRLPTIRVKEATRQRFLVNDIKSGFTVHLSRFQYGGNASVEVGVVPPGSETAEFFEEGGNLTFSKQGVYELVVESREEERLTGEYRYDGRLEVFVPPEHVAVSDVVFSGAVVSKETPKPEFTKIGSFTGYLGYEEAVERFEERFGEIGGNDSQRYAYYIGRIPVEECTGRDWTACDNSLTLAEFQDVQEANQRLRQDIWLYKYFGMGGLAFALVFVLVYWRKEQLEGYLPAMKHGYVPPTRRES